MPSSAETVCANPAPTERRLPSQPLWVPDPFEVSGTLGMRFRTIAWGAVLSAVLWGSFFLAGRTLWSLLR
jgi:hypothetical protein